MHRSTWGMSFALGCVTALIGSACHPPMLEEERAEDGQDERTAATPREQGTSLWGGATGDFVLPLSGAADPGGALIAVGLTQGRLLVVGAPIVVGTTFTGKTSSGTKITFRVRNLQSHTNRLSAACNTPAADTEYDLEYRLGGGAFAPFCPGSLWAIPVTGYWNAKGDHFKDPDVFTFACVSLGGASPIATGGVIAKCFDWCYKPYVTVGGASLENHHQACTRMARADYCGNGSPNTIDNTRIDSADSVGLIGTDCPTGPSCTAGGTVVMDFEAGWQIGNSGTAPGTTKRAAAICLSKKRWQTLPLNGACPDVLPDPRSDNSGGRYCDTPAEAQAIGGASLLHLNYSSYIDIGLWRWSNGGEQYTSTDTDGKTPPKAGYSGPLWEGTIFSPTDAPAVLPAGAKMLRTFVNGGEHFTTTTPLTPPWLPVRDEGFIYPPSVKAPVSTARKLYCFVKGAEHLTTTGSAPKGYARCFGAGTYEGWVAK